MVNISESYCAQYVSPPYVHVTTAAMFVTPKLLSLVLAANKCERKRGEKRKTESSIRTRPDRRVKEEEKEDSCGERKKKKKKKRAR